MSDHHNKIYPRRRSARLGGAVARGLLGAVLLPLAPLLIAPASVLHPSTAARPATTAAMAGEPIQPISPVLGLDPDKVRLGGSLFRDTRLSRDGTMSCATCHDLAHGGVDGRATAHGLSGAAGGVNTPTVFNAALNFRQFWDGRAATLEDQIDGPILNPNEMGTTWAELVDKLARDPAYLDAFERLYDGPPDAAKFKDAVACFERSLATPGGRFDAYLAGDKFSLNAEELRGYGLFKSLGCVSCHQGVGAGGNMFQVFGVMANYFQDRPELPADRGRFTATGDPADRHVFKVPSLRNVALTAPYFHDGSAPTLADAVRVMGEYQLGRYLTADEVRAIVAFLATLTGTYLGKPL